MTKRNRLLTGIAVAVTALGIGLAPGVNNNADNANDTDFNCEVKTMAEYGMEGEHEFICAGVGDFTDFVIVNAESGTDVYKGEIITLDLTDIDENGTIDMTTK